MKKKWIFNLPVLLVLFVFSVSWAETGQEKKDYAVYDLGEVVVSAEKPKVKEIAIVSEVTAEDIKATNSKTVAEALASVPGIRVTTGRKNEPNVFIHGFDQSRILVLIDGVPYYETNAGKLDLNQIPTDNIAKIEITKGAASVLYGANALAGVINIITKKGTETPFTGLSLELGENQSYRTSITHGMKTGIFNYWLNYSHQESNGWNLSNNYKPKTGTITRRPGGTSNAVLEDGGTRNNSDINNNDFWAKVGIEPQIGSEYFLNFHFLNKDKGVPASTDSNSVTLSRPAFSQFAQIPMYQDWGLDLDGKQKISDQLSLKAKLFYHNHVDDYASFSDQTFTKQIALSTFQDYLLGGSFFADYQPVQWDILSISFHYRGDSHKERADTYLPYAESVSYTGSMGLENELSAGKSFPWSPGSAMTGLMSARPKRPTPTTTGISPTWG